MTALKTIFFMLLVPVLLLGVMPAWLMATDTALFSFGLFRWLAVPIWLIGAAVMLWCAWDFTIKGRGTPAPIDPPRELVISGLYRFVRNPIYDGALLVLFGHVLWFPSLALLICPIIFFGSFHLFVVLYEEPYLRKTFGEAYEQYCRDVPRWLPRVRSPRR
jgi:protein-S-isoprenylcysteine O-methyltransferase Ste14